MVTQIDPFDCKICGGHFQHRHGCTRSPLHSHTPIVPARGFWKLLLKVTGAAAITMPWRTIYIQEAYIYHHALIAHEKVHIEQIKREGAFRFSVKYLWWLVTRGYYNNPFEIEAYEKAPL
jgi:hypothetical protein